MQQRNRVNWSELVGYQRSGYGTIIRGYTEAPTVDNSIRPKQINCTLYDEWHLLYTTSGIL